MAYIKDVMNGLDDSRWDFSQLTKIAKEAGGPESFVERIYDEGNLIGLIEGIVGTIVGYGIIKGGKWAYKRIKERYIEKLNKKSEYVVIMKEEMTYD